MPMINVQFALLIKKSVWSVKAVIIYLLALVMLVKLDVVNVLVIICVQVVKMDIIYIQIHAANVLVHVIIVLIKHYVLHA